MDYKYIEGLVTKCKNGDNKAKELLINEFSPLIRSLSKKFFIPGYDESDLLNEGYKALFNCVKNYKSLSNSFVGYATLGIQNEFKYCLRRNLKKSSEDEEIIFCEIIEEGVESSDVSLCDLVCTRYDGGKALSCLMELPDKHKNILDFVFVKGKPIKEYAKRNGIKYTTAVWMKNVALGELRQALNS